MKNRVWPAPAGLFDNLAPVLFVLFVLGCNPLFARITYLNGRLDHVLYSQYEPKTVVHVTIEKKEAEFTPASDDTRICFDPYEISTGWFRVKNVIMGHDHLKDTLIRIGTTSFSWPEDLVPYTEKTECILVLDRVYGEAGYRIAAVVPSLHQEFKKATSNQGTLSILEEEILAVLVQEKNLTRQDELLQQVAPILGANNTRWVEPFLQSHDLWVKRSAMAAIVYASEDEKTLGLLAADIETFFSAHEFHQTLYEEGRPGYAPYPYYYRHVFFIEERSMKFGSRWDEKEAERNLRIFNKLVKTGLISQKVQEKLKS